MKTSGLVFLFLFSLLHAFAKQSTTRFSNGINLLYTSNTTQGNASDTIIWQNNFSSYPLSILAVPVGVMNFKNSGSASYTDLRRINGEDNYETPDFNNPHNVIPQLSPGISLLRLQLLKRYTRETKDDKPKP